MAISLSTDLKDLRDYDVYDSKGEKIGNIIDIVIRTPNCEVTKYILGGSFFEELREKLGLKVDDDPVVPLELIEKIDGKKIYLSVPSNDLKNKLEPKAFESDEKMFTDLRGKNVIAKDGEVVGRIIDAVIHYDNYVNFILGDSPLREFAERIGITPDVDLLVPNQYITGFETDNIVLSVNKDELKTMLNHMDLSSGDSFNRFHAKKLAARDAQITRYFYNP